MISTIALIKYEPAYKVTLDGEVIGYVRNKEKIENRLKEYLNTKEGNIAFIETEAMPEYEYGLVSRLDETADMKVIDTVKESSVITYKTFAITINQEEKAKVATEQEAESIINEMKQNTNSELELNYGITPVYSQNLELDEKAAATEKVKTVVDEKIAAYQKEQEARKEAERKEAEKQEAIRVANLSSSKTKKVIATTAENPTGNIGNLKLSRPVSGTITSRFGNRSRGYHTGLDIATSKGTAIHPIAAGTVTYAGWKGSYGNLVIINHGNGIESYYAHCDSLFTKVGATVTSSTTISTVGSTGNSTGPHLHLEIRVNGSPKNPQQYLYQ